MANRVTADEVEAILGDHVDSDVNVSPYITPANNLVTVTLSGEGLSDQTLKDIEMWLSAHFVACAHPQWSKVKVGDGSFDFFGQVGKGLNLTFYGQQVKILDPTGKMQKIGKPKVIFQAL